ncbi:MAG: TolC family protein [Acidobacteria bacterium]|nr:TolC family protein [Acidobacteriota bacterium]
MTLRLAQIVLVMATFPVAPAAAQQPVSARMPITPREQQRPAWLAGVAARERPLTLRDALDLADRQNLDDRRAGVRSGIARQEVRESKRAWIPALVGSAGAAQTTGLVQGSFGDLKDVDYTSVAPFTRFGLGLNPAETWFGKAAAVFRAAGAQSDEQAVRRLVLLSVSQLYHQLAREQSSVTVTGEAVQNAQDLVRITDVLLRQGTGRGDDFERARTELANTELRLIEAERRRQIASIDLASALDLDPLEMLVPVDDVAATVDAATPVPDVALLVQQALDRRPEIAAARRQLDARRAERSAAVGRVAAPTLEAFYQEGLNGDRVADVASLRRYGVGATWTVSATGVERVRTAAQRIDDASLAVAQAEQGVRADVVSAWTDVQAAIARLDRARQARSAAEATLRISQVRFRNGTSLAIEVLQAQQTLESVRLAEVAAAVDADQAKVRLRAQLGPITPADIAAR